MWRQTRKPACPRAMDCKCVLTEPIQQTAKTVKIVNIVDEHTKKIKVKYFHVNAPYFGANLPAWALAMMI